MIIDFHTHIFPEKIASKTIATLEARSHMTAFTDGTLNGLCHSMEEANVNYSVVLPVVTKPSQFEHINTHSAHINNQNGILAFGGIHPDNDWECLSQIKSLGLRGIKLHPDYQDAYIDDPRYIKIITHAIELGLIIVIHAGQDIGLPNPIHCSPEASHRMINQVKEHCNLSDAHIVLAHMGGWKQWDAVEELLVGQPIYLDTSFSFGTISDQQAVRIMKNHGIERILFATDSPWSSQKETIAHINSLPLTQSEKNCIFYQNAQHLLFPKL